VCVCVWGCGVDKLRASRVFFVYLYVWFKASEVRHP
jgi:hypothetical protein